MTGQPEASTDLAGETTPLPNAPQITWMARFPVGFGLTILIAAALSLHAIGSKSFWLDEAFSAAVAALEPGELWELVARDQTNMALYYVVLHAWLKVGTSEATLRALSALFAVLALVPLYGLGLRLYGRQVALLACILLGTNAFFIQYAQEARAYSLLVLLVTSSSYLFVRSLDRRHPGVWIAYVALCALTAYTHVFGLLFIAAHAAALLLVVRPSRVSWRFYVSAYAATALLIAPLLAVVLTVRHAGWVAPTTLGTLVGAATELTGHGGKLAVVVYAALGTAALVAALRSPAAAVDRVPGWQTWFVLTWLILPPLVASTFSVLVRPIVVPRYLIAVLPALALLAAAGVSALGRRTLRIAAPVTLLAMAAGGLGRWYGEMPKEDWRGAAQYVLAHAGPGDHVAFHPQYVRTAFDYYAVPPDRWEWIPPASYALARGELKLLDASTPPEKAVAVWLLVSKERYVPLASLQPAWLRQPPDGLFCRTHEQVFQEIRVLLLLPCSSEPAPPRSAGRNASAEPWSMITRR